MHVFLNCFNLVFLGLVYKKNTLIGTMKHIIANHDKFSLLLLSCDACEAELININNMLYLHSIKLYHSSL